MPIEKGNAMKAHKIAVIAGDGIGKEVMPEGLCCIDAAARKHGIAIQWDEFDWSCDYCQHDKFRVVLYFGNKNFR